MRSCAACCGPARTTAELYEPCPADRELLEPHAPGMGIDALVLGSASIDFFAEPAKVDRMFESFGYYNVAMRSSYSLDWDAAWLNWVDREVDIVNEQHNRARQRAYFEGRPF
jgi:hypothetical protein